MKIIKTAKYKKAQNQTAQDVEQMFGGIGEGLNKGANDKAMEYAQLVMGLINQGAGQQEAFNTIMKQKGIGDRMQVFRSKIIEQIKILYSQQGQPAFEKSYDQQYSDTTLPPQRQIPAY